MKQVHTLTGLRGLAVLIVYISHSANEALLPIYLGKGFGQIGVMIFFVLSGFLMTYLYIHKDFNKKNIQEYIFARIGRILPLYYILLAISAFITYGFEYKFIFSFDFLTIIKSLLFIESKSVFWTIPVEVQFYMIFLGFWWLYTKKSSIYYLGMYIIIAFALLGFTFAFFLGVITALFFDKLKHNDKLVKIAAIIELPALFFIFINLPALRQQYNLILPNENWIWTDPLIWLGVYVCFLCSALSLSKSSILNTRFFVYLGNVSYGFYLIHYPILILFNSVNLNQYIKFILVFLITLTISSLSFYFFEKPLAKKIRALA